MDEEMQKQMSSTNKKDKIFNVRKVHYKQYDANDKYIKPNFSPFQVKQNIYDSSTQKVTKKTAEYHFHLAIISSGPYKELSRKYAQIKEEHLKQKQRKLKELKQKEEQLIKYEVERERLALDRQRLSRKRDELKAKISDIQNKNQQLRAEQMRRNEEYRVLNMQYLRNMLMSMRYQNGIDIDIDSMSYQQLLQLQDKMGSVSKGLTQPQFQNLPKSTAIVNGTNQQCKCPICFDEVKDGDLLVILPCSHQFHHDCIREWLGKEKVCPLCKQEVLKNGQSAKNMQQQVQNVENVTNQLIENAEIST